MSSNRNDTNLNDTNWDATILLTRNLSPNQSILDKTLSDRRKAVYWLSQLLFILRLLLHQFTSSISSSSASPNRYRDLERMAGMSSLPKAASLDHPLHAVGFEYDLLSPERLTGHLTITESCCQPFKVLHGGVTAMIAEGMASLGAYIASGFQRVAGIQLSTNHIKSARLGELVHVEAIPIQRGRTIQVWEVQLWKGNPSTVGDKKVLLSTSRVTLLSNLPSSKEMKGFEETVKKYAKL